MHFCSLDVKPNQRLDLSGRQRARLWRLYQLAGARPGFNERLDLLRLDRRRRDRGCAVRLQVRMGHAAHVPKLGEDHPAFGMHRIGHCAPAVDLRRGVDARGPGITLAAGLDLRALADHEPGRGTLAVIDGHQVCGDVAGLGASLARERRQDDAVFQGVAPQFDRGT